MKVIQVEVVDQMEETVLFLVEVEAVVLDPHQEECQAQLLILSLNSLIRLWKLKIFRNREQKKC